MIHTSQILGFVAKNPFSRPIIMNSNFTEIERKYHISPTILLSLPNTYANRYDIKQTYLVANKNEEVRLRSVNNSECYIVVKYGEGLVRKEYDFLLHSAESAKEVLAKAKEVIVKTRYNFGRWELDVFQGNLSGLVVAEIELTNELEVVDFPDFLKPFVIKEVTEDPMFKNKNLVKLNSLKEL